HGWRLSHDVATRLMFSSGADSFSPANRLHPHYQRANPSVSRASPFASIVYNNQHSFTYAASVAERNGLKPYGRNPPDHGLKPRGLRRVQTVRRSGWYATLAGVGPEGGGVAPSASRNRLIRQSSQSNQIIETTERPRSVDSGLTPDAPGPPHQNRRTGTNGESGIWRESELLRHIIASFHDVCGRFSYHKKVQYICTIVSN